MCQDCDYKKKIFPDRFYCWLMAYIHVFIILRNLIFTQNCYKSIYEDIDIVPVGCYRFLYL